MDSVPPRETPHQPSACLATGISLGTLRHTKSTASHQIVSKRAECIDFYRTS